MIKKLFDRYYLVLMRGFENLEGERFFYLNIACMMAMSMSLNLVSLCFLLSVPLHSLWFLAGFVIVTGVTMQVIDAIYNKKRRQELREAYADESLESRRWGVAWVTIYEVLTFALFFLPFFLSAKNAG
jgi:heme/copper-type cytochrome/quinol oxidase subunit 3